MLTSVCGRSPNGSRAGGGGGADDDGSTTASEFNGAVNQVLHPTEEPTGGTLRVGILGDCDSWDPQRTYATHCWNLHRLYTRTLMAYAPEPGADGTEVVPDLAEAAPQQLLDGSARLALKAQPQFSEDVQILTEGDDPRFPDQVRLFTLDVGLEQSAGASSAEGASI